MEGLYTIYVYTYALLNGGNGEVLEKSESMRREVPSVRDFEN